MKICPYCNHSNYYGSTCSRCSLPLPAQEISRTPLMNPGALSPSEGSLFLKNANEIVEACNLPSRQFKDLIKGKMSETYHKLKATIRNSRSIHLRKIRGATDAYTMKQAISDIYLDTNEGLYQNLSTLTNVYCPGIKEVINRFYPKFRGHVDYASVISGYGELHSNRLASINRSNSMNTAMAGLVGVGMAGPLGLILAPIVSSLQKTDRDYSSVPSVIQQATINIERFYNDIEYFTDEVFKYPSDRMIEHYQDLLKANY